MWDADQLEAMAVETDALQTAGDPLGEWLAIRARLEGEVLALAERQAVHRRSRRLRELLGPRVSLGQDPDLGRPHLLRVRGWVSELALEAATAPALAKILARPDARWVLGVRLRGSAEALAACVDVLARSRARTSLRALALELEADEAVDDPLAQLEHDRAGLRAGWSGPGAVLAERFDALCSLELDGVLEALDHGGAAPATEGEPGPWSKATRTRLGRMLASPDPERRRAVLRHLRGHGDHVAELRGLLLHLIEWDEDLRVRAAAFALVPQLGAASEAMFAVLADSARRCEDGTLQAWLERIGRA